MRGFVISDLTSAKQNCLKVLGERCCIREFANRGQAVKKVLLDLRDMNMKKLSSPFLGLLSPTLLTNN